MDNFCAFNAYFLELAFNFGMFLFNQSIYMVTQSSHFLMKTAIPQSHHILKSILHSSDRPLTRMIVYLCFKDTGDGFSDAPNKSLQMRMGGVEEIIGQCSNCRSTYLTKLFDS